MRISDWSSDVCSSDLMDPIDERQLPFVWERGLHALPTYASTLAWTRFADLDLGMTYTKIVHAEQRMVIHRPVPTTGSVYSELRVKDAVDRGAEKGAPLYFERVLRDKATDEAIRSEEHTSELQSQMRISYAGFGW